MTTKYDPDNTNPKNHKAKKEKKERTKRKSLLDRVASGDKSAQEEFKRKKMTLWIHKGEVIFEHEDNTDREYNPALEKVRASAY